METKLAVATRAGDVAERHAQQLVRILGHGKPVALIPCCHCIAWAQVTGDRCIEHTPFLCCGGHGGGFWSVQEGQLWTLKQEHHELRSANMRLQSRCSELEKGVAGLRHVTSTYEAEVMPTPPHTASFFCVEAMGALAFGFPPFASCPCCPC